MAPYLLLLVASGSLCISAQALNCTSGFDWWCEECSSGDCAANGCMTYGKSCPSLPTTNLGGWIPDNNSAEQGCCVGCAEPLWKIDSPESVAGDNVIPGVWSDILASGEQAEYNPIGPNFEMEFQITFNTLKSGWNSYIRLIAKKNGQFVDTTAYPGRLVSGWQKSGEAMTLCFGTGPNIAKCANIENLQVGTPVKVKLVLANNHTVKYYADDVLLRTEQLADDHPTSPDYVGQYPVSQTYLRLADSYHAVADATVNNLLAVNKPGAEDSYPLCSAPVRATCGDADGAGTAKVAVTCPSGYGTKADTTNTLCVGKTCDTSAASSTDTATCCEVITTTITTTATTTITISTTTITTTATTTITTTTLTTATLTATATDTTATTTVTTTLTTTTLTATATSTTATTTITSSTVSSTTLTTATKTNTALAGEESELSLSTTQSAQAAILFFVLIWQTAGSLQDRGC